MAEPVYSFQCLHENGDCTIDYSVTIKKSCTLREFIDHIVKSHREWGYIGICADKRKTIFGCPYIEYNNGRIITPDWEDMMRAYLDSMVVSASYRGGLSRGDWLFEVESKDESSQTLV